MICNPNITNKLVLIPITTCLLSSEYESLSFAFAELKIMPLRIDYDQPKDTYNYICCGESLSEVKEGCKIPSAIIKKNNNCKLNSYSLSYL